MPYQGDRHCVRLIAWHDWKPEAGRGKGGGMSDPVHPQNKNPMGGGAPIALLTIAGTFIGGFLGQPSIGLLVGLGIGVIIALLIWWQGR